MFLFAKESGYTPSVAEIYVVNSVLTQLGMLAVLYRNEHLGIWYIPFLLTHICCAFGVAGCLFLLSSLQWKNYHLCLLALPSPDAPEGQHTCICALQLVPD